MYNIHYHELSSSLLSIINNKHKNGTLLFTISLAVVVLTLSVALPLHSMNAHAQEYTPTPPPPTTTPGQRQTFSVVVQVTNNANADVVGTIHVAVDGTDLSKVLNGVVIPAKSTVSHTFEFDSDDVPVGKGFTAEMVYGNDIFKRTYGVNSPSNTPEIAQIAIP